MTKRSIASVEQIVDHLGLEPHPEGGWYARFFTHPIQDAHGRPLMTSIHYLLPAGGRSHWHRIDAVELWSYAAGAPIELRTSADGAGWQPRILGPDLGVGEVPTVLVPAGTWQSAECSAAAGPRWSLVSCTVSPGFRFEGFELAPPCWEPGLDR